MSRLQFVWATVFALAFAGCTTSSAPSTAPAAGGPAATSKSPANASEEYTATGSAAAPSGDPLDVPIMTELNGIPIPRLKAATQQLQLGSAIPADVGNDYAARRPKPKATGDWLTIRFESEPKNLNPMTENSNVARIMMSYVNEGLAWQNRESFVWEPRLASKWVAEDSIKLSPDYPGKERRVALADGQPSTELELEYVAAAKNAEPTKIDLRTLNAAGEPVGKTWVGVFPVGRIVGAPVNGYHQWSDDQGKLAISGMPTGKYTVKVGAELYGLATKAADGSLTVTAGSPENPLSEELRSANQSDLKLSSGQWIDLQQKTYYTYCLRPEAKWSDGQPFTTRDLEFTYAVMNNPTVDNESIRGYYSDLVECAALSPQIVRMRYRQQYFLAPDTTAELSLFAPPYHRFAKSVREVLHSELTLDRLTPEEEAQQKKISAYGAAFGKFFNTDEEYNLKPLGTGPYIVDRWERGDRVELARNPGYWRPEKAAFLDRVIVKFIPDTISALRALQAGELDFCFRLTAEQFFEDLKGPPEWLQGKYVKAAWFSPAFSYFGWNMLKPQFQDRRVRVALGMLFDKQTFLEEKLYHAGAVVSGPQYYFSPGYDRAVQPIGYDPDAARELLADAGWIDTDGDGLLDKDGKPMRLVLPMSKGRPDVEQRAQVFQKNLKDVGIELDIQFLEWASFLEKLKAKDFDVCTLSWAMPIESDPHQIWHSNFAGKDSRGSNHVSFRNARADELIEQMRITIDPGERHHVSHALHRLLDAEQPYMFLYCPQDFGVYHQRFRNVKWYRLRPGFELTEWYVPKDEQIH